LTEGWIKSMWCVIHTHNGILLSHKKECSLTICNTWMELESIMLSEISQSEKDKYHMISLICGIKETKQMNMGKKREANHKTDS